MKDYIVAGLAASLIAGGLIASAPPASAGCLYGGLSVSRCDGPAQADGTWKRCVVFSSVGSGSGLPYGVGDTPCDLMSPDQHPWGLAFADPPTHIDD
jgi:hypothetical protein